MLFSDNVQKCPSLSSNIQSESKDQLMQKAENYRAFCIIASIMMYWRVLGLIVYNTTNKLFP